MCKWHSHITYGYDSIQRVEINKLLNLTTNATIYDCFHFGNSRVWVKFSFCKDILQMLTYGRNTDPKELRHSLLRTPKSFVFDCDLYLALIIGHGI